MSFPGLSQFVPYMMMQNLVEFHKRAAELEAQNIRISFNDSKVFVSISFLDNIFSSQILLKEIEYEDILKYYKRIQLMCELPGYLISSGVSVSH